MPEPESLLLHEWLRATAARSPDRPAIVEYERITSFAQLLGDAERLSGALVRRGLTRGDRVALILPKSTEAITYVFASLLAGAIYVPIQPRWPRERIDATLADCSPRFVIRECEGAPAVTDLADGTRTSWAEALASSAPAPAEAAIDPADPAFILFTSGSTGRPKGVVISHRAAAAFVKWSAEEFQIRADDRIACPSPLSFDLSTFDIFNMALRGAACVLVPDDIVWMPRFLTRFVAEQRITVWYSVPSILAGMLNEGGFSRGSYPELRAILFAGEVISGRNVARLQAAAPAAVCANLYGPTETNVITWYRVPPGFDPARAVPIGVACPYADLAVDSSTSELLAGGDSQMTGYWNRPIETAAAFVTLSGKRYYRTGDRVSPDAGRDYSFLGRLDRQVKRRGFRIELGEIEAALGRHDAVLEAAVIATQDEEAGTVITAFVRARREPAPSMMELKTHCAQILPASMAPDRIVLLEAMPKGSRGKIDYAALKELQAEVNDGGHQSGSAPVHP